MRKQKIPAAPPTIQQLRTELQRVKYKSRYKRVLWSTIYTLIVVAAVAVLVATIWMPVLQIYGTSMMPTLNEGDIVVEPNDMDALQMVPGQDLCTLVTCTPYGINSHRLLVRGHRIDNIPEAKIVHVTADATQIEPMIVAPIVAIPMLLMLLLFLLLPKTKKKSGGDTDEET